MRPRSQTAAAHLKLRYLLLAKQVRLARNLPYHHQSRLVVDGARPDRPKRRRERPTATTSPTSSVSKASSAQIKKGPPREAMPNTSTDPRERQRFRTSVNTSHRSLQSRPLRYPNTTRDPPRRRQVIPDDLDHCFEPHHTQSHNRAATIDMHRQRENRGGRRMRRHIRGRGRHGPTRQTMSTPRDHPTFHTRSTPRRGPVAPEDASDSDPTLPHSHICLADLERNTRAG